MPEKVTPQEHSTVGQSTVEFNHNDSPAYVEAAKQAGVDTQDTEFLDRLGNDDSVDGSELASGFFANVPEVAGEAPAGTAEATDFFGKIPSDTGDMLSPETVTAVDQSVNNETQTQAKVKKVVDNPQEGVTFGAKQGFSGGAENIAAQVRPEPKAKPDFSKVEYGGDWDASQMVSDFGTKTEAKPEEANAGTVVEAKASDSSQFEKQQEVMDRIKGLNAKKSELRDALDRGDNTPQQIEDLQSDLSAVNSELAAAEAESMQQADSVKAELEGMKGTVEAGNEGAETPSIEDVTNRIDVLEGILNELTRDRDAAPTAEGKAEMQAIIDERQAELDSAIAEKAKLEDDNVSEQEVQDTEAENEAEAVENQSESLNQELQKMTVEQLKSFIARSERMIATLRSINELVNDSQMSEELKTRMTELIDGKITEISQRIAEAQSVLEVKESAPNESLEENLLGTLMEMFKEMNSSEMDDKDLRSFLQFILELITNFNFDISGSETAKK